jgi:ribonucleoside-diphosphate reductase alpha chain
VKPSETGEKKEPKPLKPKLTELKPELQGEQQYLGSMMGDAPLCPTCGHITIRNGACYKCLNCGTSLGCS